MAFEKGCAADAIAEITAPIGSERITEPSQLKVIDANSLVVCGTTVRNTEVPYQFRGLLVGGIHRGRDQLHAAIVVEGKFNVDGKTRKVMLLDRWVGCITIDFFENRLSMFDHIHKRGGTPGTVTDVQETVPFQTKTGASAWMKLAMEDFPRKFLVVFDKATTEQTNCALFAVRFAEKMGHEKAFKQQLEQCYFALCAFRKLPSSGALPEEFGKSSIRCVAPPAVASHKVARPVVASHKAETGSDSTWTIPAVVAMAVAMAVAMFPLLRR